MEQDLKELKIELSKNGIFTTTLEEIYNWGRKNSVWPLTFGLACCAIEMIATTMARYDLARLQKRWRRRWCGSITRCRSRNT